ncbi:MAG: NAD-dependent epimerase/dehydratase family protein [Bacteroidetes bacterium]|nr:NAD-dependent epimerase/dehydratase family protein [Bacteroidota bacterium]
MIIGNGMVAKGFRAYDQNDEVIIFASGVSNSANTDRSQFDKEQAILEKAILENPFRKFIYFSTCSVYDHSLRQAPYVLHKLAMEALIENTHSNFLIFRVSNIAGKTKNPHTVLNYFYNHIMDGSHFNLWETAQRNIISMDDLFSICDYIIQHTLFKNEILNVANKKNYDVKYIVQELEKFTGRKAHFTSLQKGSGPLINLSKIDSLFTKMNIQFNDDYLQKVMHKYFNKI